ncbi:hypothetical protein GCM10011399_31100 [Subtercola lobariae]|uniref:Uncharacterized protein n=1 Tax=Subtercola lobariae TaxID=1588641 RepID=A0A917BD89_9MICO|nr:hypothetical protein GCM10011399_31100 [Subtercola lobariae]
MATRPVASIDELMGLSVEPSSSGAVKRALNGFAAHGGGVGEVVGVGGEAGAGGADAAVMAGLGAADVPPPGGVAAEGVGVAGSAGVPGALMSGCWRAGR